MADSIILGVAHCRGAVALFLSGCASYVERDQFNTAINDIHATDQKLQSEVDSLSQKYDAIATEVAGRVRVEAAAHLATGDATLREQDKPFLADFAKVIGSRHPDALITVEGFADPQGPTAYNPSARPEARPCRIGLSGQQWDDCQPVA